MNAEPVAIIGIACRLPGGASDPESLWRLLEDRTDAIAPIPAGRWDVERYYSPRAQQAGRMNARQGGFLDGVDAFDAAFFGISPRVAEQMDPQQRLLLEVSWEALEDAGVVPERLARSRTGVFMGVCSQDYGGLQSSPGELDGMGAHSATGTFASIVSNRISYTFDLRGPSMTLDTACSSSLVAVHLACQSLRRGESDLAVVGGVNLMLTPQFAIALSQAAMLSPDGRSRAFDATANGYVRGEGAGVVILKPLCKALEDGDRIYAVVRGSSVNQDGRTQGITVPSGEAQEANFRASLEEAGVAPREVGYIEAHGTGTPVGDPIEANALGRVVSEGREANRVAYLGSIKTNIGHLEAGAGIAGLIKAALAVHHRKIPASLHFQVPNPEIDFERSRLRVPSELVPWPSCYERAIAGVNSFGFGGTNASAVLEEPPAAARRPAASAKERAGAALLPISGRSEQALRVLAEAYADMLEREGDEAVELGQVAEGAALRRSHHAHRLAVVATGAREAAAKLRAFVEGQPAVGLAVGSPRRSERGKVAFVFNGQGPQWWAMGRTLLETSPLFREKVLECDALARKFISWSLVEALTADEASSRVGETHCLQPTMFALQVAMAALWRASGVEPDAVIGHSMGEIAAAHVSGSLSLESALRIICHRARIQEKADPEGAMMFVAVSREEALALCAESGDRLWVSAENSPRASTLSGPRPLLEGLERRLSGQGVFARMLRVNCACHSPQMDPLKDELMEAIAGVRAGDCAVPMYSTTYGQRLEGRELAAPYWWENFRRPVLFEPAIRAMLADGFDTFIELSPHPVLANSLDEIFEATRSDALVLATLSRKENDWETFTGALAALYVEHGRIDWARRYPGGAPALRLPKHPFHREVFWNESKVGHQYRAGGQTHPMLKRIDAALPTWEIRWDDHRLSWVREHEVFGAVVVPGASYLEAVLAAARELTGEPCALESVDFERPCILVEGEQKITRLTLDPEAGTFELFYRAFNEDRWVRNAKGRFYRAPFKQGAERSPRRLDLQAIRGRCPHVHKAIDIYDLMRRKGYAYGPSFFGIRQLHMGQGEALARVEVPPLLRSKLSGFLIHPALLDACLQSSILHPAEGHGGALLSFTYLPTDIQKLRVYGEIRFPAWCYTRIHKLDASGLSVDIFLVGEQGELLAEITPLRGKVVRGSASEPAFRLAEDLYRLEWQPSPEPAASQAPGAAALTLGPLELKKGLDAEAAGLARRLGRQAYQTTYQEQLRALCGAYVVGCLERLGRELKEGERLSVEDFPSVLPRYRRALTRYLGFLAEDGLLQREGQAFRVARAPARPEREDAGRLWSEVAGRHPSCHAELALLRKTGSQLDQVLTGAVDVLHLLFPEGSQAEVEPIYQSSPIARLYNLLARSAVARLAATADARRTLRVLEVGAGTGGLTAHVLPVLPEDRCEYVYTDVSPLFLQSAREKFAAYGFVAYRALDLEKDLLQQGLEEGSFDLILASDALHATGDLKGTLRRLEELLAPRGVLALIEAVPSNRWLDLTFGLTEGWWSFRDHALRKEGPLLGPEAWQTLLRESGYDEVAVVTDPDHPGHGAQALLLARAPGSARQPARAATEAHPEASGDWIIFADAAGLGRQLAERLLQQGARALLVRPGSAFDASGVERTIRPRHAADYDRLLDGGAPRGVIHLWSADMTGASPDARSLEAAVELGPLSAIRLVQALHRKAPGAWPRLFVFTRGAHAVRNETPNLEGAPAWGLGLSLGLEHPELRCKLIDLDLTPGPEGAAAAWAELWRDDAETEVVLRHRHRFTRRLVRVSPQQLLAPVDARTLPSHQGFVLETETPGPLDQLRYRAVERAAPAAGQVEVEVVAAGMNYLDVMTALGQVPILESERSFRFGAECAGVVVRVGEGVVGVAPGDPVVALSSAQGTIASHITVDATYVFPRPSRLSFEEAASLPIVFLTAWYALRKLARIERGERVLIHSAAGGTGLAALQIARMLGAEVFATAGSPEKRDYLRSLGVEVVMDSRSLDFGEEILRRTGGAGVDVILNTIAGEAVARGLSCLAPYGRFVEIGKRDLLADRKVGLRPFLQNLSYFSFDLRQMLIDRPRAVRAELEELLRLFDEGVLSPLPHRAIHPSQAEAAFRHMAQARHTGKLVLAMDEREVKVVPEREPSPGSLQGTWLIAGGLGGVGLAMAGSLASAGARHLVLLGRSGIKSEEHRQQIEALRARGVDVRVEAVDVTSRAALKALLERAERELPPIQGVLHCAMVLDDMPLVRLDEEAMMKVVRPKVLGAWHLHELTAHLPLQAFVLFSSATSVVGNRGQCSYAVANTFLDHLAHARRARGLKALSVNWGAISDVGYVARHEGVGRRVAAAGMRGFTSAEAFQALRALLGGSAPQVGVLPMDWEQFFQQRGADAATRARYGAVLAGAPEQGGAADAAASQGSLAQQLRRREGPRQREFLKAHLRARICAVLGIPSASFDDTMPLIDYLDSLLAVEISAWMERELNVKVTIMELMKGPSLDQLTDHLRAQIG
ncbi:SDR family NAD(P)-dependent oxidoreductase [Sorangium sp. So ce291]|uniref:SDR family NAD(P)-dependent oxidoreductase n=1 Tax=Sorangium sp. So ce291 TaxID=3133294 RepID=UPI003F646BE9